MKICAYSAKKPTARNCSFDSAFKQFGWPLQGVCLCFHICVSASRDKVSSTLFALNVTPVTFIIAGITVNICKNSNTGSIEYYVSLEVHATAARPGVRYQLLSIFSHKQSPTRPVGWLGPTLWFYGLCGVMKPENGMRGWKERSTAQPHSGRSRDWAMIVAHSLP